MRPAQRICHCIYDVNDALATMPEKDPATLSDAYKAKPDATAAKPFVDKHATSAASEAIVNIDADVTA